MAHASLEDCQLFAQSEILQRDLFIAAKQQEDHPKKREDCVQHEAESVSASSLTINRFRNRWNSGEAQASFRSSNVWMRDLWFNGSVRLRRSISRSISCAFPPLRFMLMGRLNKLCKPGNW